MKKISLYKLQYIKDPIIIDIRDKDEFLSFHLWDSINIPFLELYNNYQKYLDKLTTYYIICNTGYRSKKIVKRLSLLGYNVYLVKKGLQNSKTLIQH